MRYKTRASARRLDLRRRVIRSRSIYLFVAPTILFFLVFSFIPYYGLTIAFRDFRIYSGLSASPWVGIAHFRAMFSSPDFPRLIRNTLLISTYRIVFGFPVPILFALLLNEVRHLGVKRVIQTVTYFPHFLSWVVYGGIVLAFVQPTGIVNEVLVRLGGERLSILTSGPQFIAMIITTDILKSFGFGAIVYLAALASVDPQLYEAAAMDGATRIQQAWHVTIPGILPVIVVMFILSLGGIMDAGFDQIFVLYNAAVLHVADIIDTYVFRIGLQNARYSLGTAVGLFKGVIGFALILTANSLIRRTGEYSLW